jgi:hypothetical protein
MFSCLHLSRHGQNSIRRPLQALTTRLPSKLQSNLQNFLARDNSNKVSEPPMQSKYLLGRLNDIFLIRFKLMLQKKISLVTKLSVGFGMSPNNFSVAI